MANALFDWGRDGFLTGAIDWDTGTTSGINVDEADDSIDLVNDDNYDDRASAARVGTKTALTSNVSIGAGVADAADLTFTAVTGDQFESLDLFEDTGVESTSRLICNIDTATGLPFTPSGGDIQWQWDNGGNRIFKL